jgi:2-succinyl-5-enolpyruvyl-6-hydroxy-3-cyclohexene-1-carboxylate synthase
VIAGQGAVPVPGWLAALPRVAEPGSPLWGGSLTAGPWLLGTLDRRLRPEHVVVIGRPTLHRSVQRLLADPAVGVTVLSDRPQWTDVAGIAHAVHRCAPSELAVNVDQGWADGLRAADAAAAEAVRAGVDKVTWPTGPAVARDTVAELPPGALLVLGSSNPVRDVAIAARPRADLVVHTNRGVAGIDGTVSTAIGAAIAHGQPSYALVGDITFLHDSTGLIIGPREPRPDLTIVVLNDDGGGIFALLEQGAPEYAPAFERIFGTPHGVDLAALCAATRTPHVVAGTRAELARALRPAGGIRVVEVRADRRGLRELHANLRAAVAESLGSFEGVADGGQLGGGLADLGVRIGIGDDAAAGEHPHGTAI